VPERGRDIAYKAAVAVSEIQHGRQHKSKD